jgi:dihydrofolate reductase
MICAVGKNNEIGFKNSLLWNLPQDLKHFKETTSGHSVIMGQKTFESIGRVLPGRKNIILSLDPNFKIDGAEVSNDLMAVLNKYKDSEEETFVIGGASIYKQALPFAKKLYLTLVDDSREADVFFPDYSEFHIVKESEVQEENGVSYKFTELIK